MNDHTDHLHVIGLSNATGDQAVDPTLGDTPRIGHDAVDHLNDGIRQITQIVVVSLDRIGRQGRFPFLTQRTAGGMAGLRGDGDPALPAQPGARRGDVIPGIAVGMGDVLADVIRRLVVGDIHGRGHLPSCSMSAFL